MNRFYIIDNPEIEIKLENVMSAMDCRQDSDIYETMTEEFYDVYDEVMKLLAPVGILGFGTVTKESATEKYPEGTRVIYAVTSVGEAIHKRSTQAFNDGDYVRGMLYDVMADSALFSMEKSLREKLKAVCEENKIGISARLEAPHDIPITAQKDAWEQLCLKERLGIDISSGYMLDPVKSSCQVFVASDDENEFRPHHNCRKCPNVNCKFRNVQTIEIEVQKGTETKVFQLEENESLMNGLIRNGYYISAVCGGKGRCGKCKIRVVKGDAPISGEDIKFFSQKELDEGWRLSCLLYPEDNLTISFELDDESDFEIVSYYDATDSKADEGNKAFGKYDIAIDIGTTTIVFQLVDKSSGEICHTTATINRQRRYGADVISRIMASVGGKGEELKESIREDLKNGILSLCSEYGIAAEQIVRIAVSANTTMVHLLMGYDCTTLGQYPFTPVNIDFIKTDVKELTGLDIKAEATVLAGISTYVGGDIVSGLYACGFDKTDDICLLIDLGTNGEMAIGNRQRILTTSTAAGPAFEGGNISCGTGSVDGAVCSVKLNKGAAVVKTIRYKAPVGICGTGVVELVAEMLREEIVDETGLLDEDYFDDGFPVAEKADGEKIVFTQKDIRELQLAKAAIRAGAETLISRYGVKKEQISKVYIAGGFGYRLDIEKAAEIGMLPPELTDRTEAVGNTSLSGCVKFLKDNQAEDTIRGLLDASEEISLSMDKDFNDLYMESMMF